MNQNLWQKLSTLCKQSKEVQERVNELYGRTSFPYKIRSLFADWIEAQDWDSIDIEDDETGKRKAENMYKELVMKIDSSEDGLQKGQSFDLEKTLDYQQAKKLLMKSFDGNYVTFVRVVRTCLKEERLLCESSETDNCDLKRKTKIREEDKGSLEIKQKLTNLQQQVLIMGQKVIEVHARQDQLRLDLCGKNEQIQKLDAQLQKNQQQDLAKMKDDIKKMVEKLISENYIRRKEMANGLVVLAQQLTDVLYLVWRKIDSWKKEQKQEITALVKPTEGAIDVLDQICHIVGELLITMNQQVVNALEIFKLMMYTGDPLVNDLQMILDGFRKLLFEHLQRVFVVEKNIRDRVLKVSSGKSLGFGMSVRILGGVGLGLNFSLPKVSMSLFHEKNLPPGNDHIAGDCTIMNGHERTFSVSRGTNTFSAEFHSVQLKHVKRPDKGKNEELVTENKYAFVFFTSVSLLDEIIPLKVISLPVILTSQTSQEIMAKGTLIWDAAFSDEGQREGWKPFEYKDTVPWSEVAKVLNALFLQHTGRSLTPDHLLYLAKMAFRYKEPKKSSDAGCKDFDVKPITEKQVVRDKLNGREFSFWKWFYACMNLVVQHIKREWNDRKIYGFISKEDAKRKLKDSSCGTFLLRFSESNIENSQKSDICGYLTVAVMEMDPESGQKKLFHVKDYLSPKEIHEKGLSPILDAMEVADFQDQAKKKRLLQYLWPEVDSKFEDLFSHYIRDKESSEDGYRRGKYTIEIFLTDEQNRRACQDSVCDTNSCPPSVQSNISVSSPMHNNVNEAQEFLNLPSDSFEYMHQMMFAIPNNAQQRPLAAVRPHTSQTMQYDQATTTTDSLNASEYDSDMSQMILMNDEDLMGLLRPDEDGDLVLNTSFLETYNTTGY